ncbi:MAG: ABC transporter ATP-binding protein [Nitrospinota bacterium]
MEYTLPFLSGGRPRKDLPPEVEARDLVKRYGALTAVDGLSFAVEAGECFGFLGPNGAGKTTTIKMLYGAARPSGGGLRVFGRDAVREQRRIKAQLGVLPQEETLDIELTVWENLLVYGRYFGLPRREVEGRARELLAFLQLEEKARSTIKTLSGGMKRRLLLARALIARPRLLILDEPTTGLDPQARHLIWERLRALQREGVTLILTTHYMDEAARLCDRVGVMDRGRFLAEGPPGRLVEELVGREVVELRVERGEGKGLLERLDGFAFSVERAGDTLYIFSREGGRVAERLLAEGVRHLWHRPATLEDLFLKLTGRELRE